MKPNDIKSKIAELQAEQEATEAFLGDYPSDLPEPGLLVWHHSKLCEFGLIFKIKTMSEAIDIIGTLWNHPQVRILPLSLSRGTFTTFRTPEHEPERGETSSKPVFPVTVKVSNFELGFHFYAMIGDHLLSVGVEFEYGSNWQRYASVYFHTYESRSAQGRHTTRTDKSETILSTPAFHMENRIKWAQGSGDYPNDFTLYWTHAESLLDLIVEDFYHD